MVARRLADPGFSSEALDWPTYDAVSQEAVALVGAEQGEQAYDALAALRHYLVSNFHLPAYPMGRLIRALTLLASPRWEGTVRLSEQHEALAREIFEIEGAGWESGRQHLRWLVQDALAALRRRPRQGQSLDKILMLLYAFAEGAVDHLMTHPEVISPDDVVEAIVLLGYALTEEGSMTDPRLPDDPEARATFTDLVARADAAWMAGEDLGDLHVVADRFEVPFEVVVLLFPRLEDLADSVVRARVISGGVEGGAPAATFALLAASLHRLATAADETPSAVELAHALDGEGSVFDELRGLARQVAESSVESTMPVDRVVEQIIVNAAHGRGSWATVEVLLEALRPTVPQ
jgi:hypothetical protein